MITGRIKDFRFIKEPVRMGFFAFFSVITRIAKVISAGISTRRNGAEVQPKFCPKDGIQSKRPKKTMTKKAPARSKFFRGFLTKVCGGRVKKHRNRKMAHRMEEIHISVRQPENFKIIPPRVGPKMTAALEISM